MTQQSPLKNATIAAVMTAVIVTPIFGLQLVRQGARTLMDRAGTWSRWPARWFCVPTVAPMDFQALQGAENRPADAAVGAGARPQMAGRAADRRRGDLAVLQRAQLGGHRHAGADLRHAGPGAEHRGRLRRPARPGLRGLYAVGAYTYALLYHWGGWSFWEALPFSARSRRCSASCWAFRCCACAATTWPSSRWAFGEIIRLLLINLNMLTGGPDGISGLPKPSVLGMEMARRASTEGGQTFHEIMGWTFQNQHMVIYLYLMALALALATLFVSTRLIRMPVGRAWEALREDEIACRSLGLNPTRIKLSAFTLGAMFAGFGGAFFAARQGMVNPESFTFIESALILAIVVLGGMGSQIGVILAAILLTVLPELAREFAEYRMLMFGLVMVLMMMCVRRDCCR